MIPPSPPSSQQAARDLAELRVVFIERDELRIRLEAALNALDAEQSKLATVTAERDAACAVYVM